jgi:transcriptional regulator with XRE-family HTH domain
MDDADQLLTVVNRTTLLPDRFPSRSYQLELIPAYCRAARALLSWTKPKLAEASGLGLSNVVDFERNRRIVSAEAVQAIRCALESAGVEFTSGDEPGVRLRKGAPRDGQAASIAVEDLTSQND